MRPRARYSAVAAMFAALTLSFNLHAQPLVNIQTVTVGDAGNAADTTGYGAVADVFAIGKYEVTISQYTTFLNSVASVTSDSYIVNLWNANMTSNLNIAGISRSGAGTLANPYSYSVIGSGNRPIAFVSWFDAARFANWMNNGATNGASTETGSYTLNGATTGIITKNANATWFIPSEDQWYKAAYFNGGGGYWLYPTANNIAPGNFSTASTNQANYYDGVYAVTQSSSYSSTQNYLTDVGAFSYSASAYGTFDQGGNVWEWNDAVIDGSSRGLRGGSFDATYGNLESSISGNFDPTNEFSSLGFRVATVPEPSTYALVLMAGAGALCFARRKRHTIRRQAMRTHNASQFIAATFAALTLSFNLHAQPLVNIQTVTVGDPGNAADTTGYGAVTNVFRIGKYEVTIGQYTEFLNSVARTNTNSYIVNLWNADMTNDLNIAGISRSGALAGPYSYSVIGSGNRPIAYVSWFDAARFVNWLHNGATNGASTETGAYTLNGATTGIITKNAGATWWIPNENEWYKAAYYKGGGTNAGYWLYPTKSDSAPGNNIGGATNQANYYAGDYAVTQSSSYSSTQNYLTDAGAFSNSASAYGTFDQGGNVWEWNDAVVGSSESQLGFPSRGLRGGSWYNDDMVVLQSSKRSDLPPSAEGSGYGFRVASVASANVVLTVEKSTNLSGQWQFDREINVGPMTNTNEFYRLKIGTVVQ